MLLYDLIDLIMITKKLTKKKKIKLSPEQRKTNTITRTFKKKIVSSFKNMWFGYLNTEWIHKKFHLQKWEFDMCFIYENILLICEDTLTSKENIKEHLRKKSVLYSEVLKDKNVLMEWLKNDFKDKFSKDDYDNNQYKIFFLYFPRYETELTEDDKKLFNNTQVIEYDDLNYFNKMSNNLKYSSITEFFRFLKIKWSDIWNPSSKSKHAEFSTIIIAPEASTKLKNWVRAVSFMMSANMLMNNAYVLRKDNWEESSLLYQRLIEKRRIESIRQYVANNKESFINNVIVTLPNTICFENSNWDRVWIDQITEYWNFKIKIPDEINSIWIIDWQHRIFAHYHWIDKYEKDIEKLRNKLHLLVTWLIFPNEMTERQKMKQESEIFLSINSNIEKVPGDVILHIEALKEPFWKIWIAREVIKWLNNSKIFKNAFELSLMKKAKIKVSSIIKFALGNMVEIDDNKETFYKYWNNINKNKLISWISTEKEELLDEYISFIVNSLNEYFRWLKSSHSDAWEDNDSKILSVVSINWFLIALRDSFSLYWIQNFDFYNKKFSNLKVDFSKEKFPFVSSQYFKFAIKIKEIFI